MKIMSTKQNILAEMKTQKDTNDVDTALDYMNQLVEAGMDFPDAEAKVLDHFDGVSQDELQEAYDSL